MYKVRRVEEIIDKVLGVMSVKADKFAHNENAPNMELKYDIWCSNEEVFSDVVDKLNSLFNTPIAEEIGYVEEEKKYLICIFLTWSIDEAISACDRENEMVKYYFSNNKSLGISGSYESDLKVLSDKKYSWGVVDTIG